MMSKKEDVLMKNNMLVTARYSLSLVQSRIFITMLYKLQKDSSGTMSCTISTQEFKSIINNKNQQSPKQITKMLKELMSKIISFKLEKENKTNNIWSEYTLINGYDYDDELDTFRIECSPRVYELLMSYLDIGYTPINMQVWLSLNNTSAQRLYDLLRLWSYSKNTITYTVDELRELFMMENKYKNYNDFKKKVIVPAVDTLNNTNMFDISFEESKKGKKINAIDFKVKDLDKRKYFQEKFDIFDKEVKEEPVNKSDVMYIPDKSVFTVGTLRAFKSDFCKYDFNNVYLEMAFEDAVNITLEREEKEKVYMNAYKFFKGTLKNKIEYYLDQEAQDEEHRANLEQFW